MANDIWQAMVPIRLSVYSKRTLERLRDQGKLISQTKNSESGMEELVGLQFAKGSNTGFYMHSSDKRQRLQWTYYPTERGLAWLESCTLVEEGNR
jgi:hypothetical protein